MSQVEIGCCSENRLAVGDQDAVLARTGNAGDFKMARVKLYAKDLDTYGTKDKRRHGGQS